MIYHREAETRAAFGVVLAAILFGSTFSIMQEAIERASVTAFLATRFVIGGVVVLAYAAWRDKGRVPRGSVRPALLCAIPLAAGYALQTIGLQYTSTSNSAFITYLLVVFVPVFAALAHRHVPPRHVMAGLVVAVFGLWLLTNGGKGFGRGEVLTLGCAISYALHILVLDWFSPRRDTAWLTGLQLLAVGVGFVVPGAVQGGYDFGLTAWLGAAATGVGASAVAFSLQVSGQRRIGPTRTALLLMVEPVTAAFIGYAIGERLGVRGAAGAVVILGGIALAESRPPNPAPRGPTMRESPVISGHSGVSGTTDLGGTP